MRAGVVVMPDVPEVSVMMEIGGVTLAVLVAAR
jgi:hypothetical protein